MPIEIDNRYDIKGSLYGRKTRKTKNQKVDKNIALKDLDLIEDKTKICLSKLSNRYLGHRERLLFV